MKLVDPSITRYHNLRQVLDRLPESRDGTKMNLEHMDVPQEKGTLAPGSRIDQDPESVDILHLSRERGKEGFRAESFVEMPRERSFWGRPKGNQTLLHLSRQVSYLPGGYGLSEVALRTVDLVTGEALSEIRGERAVREAQKLEDRIPFRLHHIDPQGLERREENWLSS